MKFQHLLFIVLMIGGISCAKTTEKEESNYKTYSFAVNISESDSNFFENSILIDLRSNEFIVENFSNIVGYKLSEIKFQFSDFSGNEVSKGDLEIGFSLAGQSIGNSITISEIDLNEFSDQDDFLYVTLSPTTINLVQEVMNNHHQISLDVVGNVSDKPVSFTTTLFVTIVIKSN